MPANLRLAALLVGICIVAAILGVAGVYWQYDRQGRIQPEASTQGDFQASKAAIDQFGCTACHQIPGAKGGSGSVGPFLKDFAGRTTTAGRLSNDSINLVRWIRHPQDVVPGNAMPDLGLTETQARDISAYLYTLR